MAPRMGTIVTPSCALVRPGGSPRRARELGERTAVGAVVHERREPAPACLLALRADHPPGRRAPVPGRSRLPELPRVLHRAELLLVLGPELRVRALVRVDARAFVRPRLERSETRRPHPS